MHCTRTFSRMSRHGTVHVAIEQWKENSYFGNTLKFSTTNSNCGSEKGERRRTDQTTHVKTHHCFSCHVPPNHPSPTIKSTLVLQMPRNLVVHVPRHLRLASLSLLLLTAIIFSPNWRDGLPEPALHLLHLVTRVSKVGRWQNEALHLQCTYIC